MLHLHRAFHTRLGRLAVGGALLSALSAAAACRGAAPEPGAAPVSADTWAMVDGREITKEQVEEAYRRTQDAAQTLSEEEGLAIRLSILDDLIMQDILLARARELKIEVPESELDTAFNDAKQNISDEAFQEELKRRSLTPSDMREGLRRELLAQKVLEREVTSKVAVADREVTEFFEANRAQFNLAEESYRVAQIVVTPTADPQLSNRAGDDAATPQAAQEKVGMLMERLKAGTPFSELAVNYSEDPQSGPRGGDLGLVPVSALKQAPPPLRDAVLKSKPGTVNVVSAGGAHTIVLVVSHEPAGQRDLSLPAVREGITGQIRARKEQLLRTAYLTTARNDARVVNYAARRIVESQAPPPAAEPAAQTPAKP